MLIVLNKNKIISYTVASSVVAILFVLSIFLAPREDVTLVPASSNIVNETKDGSLGEQ